MNSSPTIAKVAAAFVAAQAELGHAPKDATNPHFKSKYADLATVIETVRPVLAKHKLAVLQSSLPCDSGMRLQTVLLHESGEWLADDGIHSPLQKQDAQGVGSATTYLRRYGLAALLGVAQDDDDGNAASQPAAPKKHGYTFSFGKHKDKHISEVPADYLVWLMDQPPSPKADPEQRERAHQIYRAELDRREATNAA
jgi:hypothetical protein